MLKRKSSASSLVSAAAGYSDLTGGYEGGQAEYARVPFGAQDLFSKSLDIQPPVLCDFLLKHTCMVEGAL